MPFQFKKFLDHGTTNPIVARLSLQILQILQQCDLPKTKSDEIGSLYLSSLQKGLIRCWEIEQRLLKEFRAAIETYKPPSSKNQVIHVPQMSRLEEECRNFLYGAKTYVRDFLTVFNLLYGTHFTEASESSRARKGKESV